MSYNNNRPAWSNGYQGPQQRQYRRTYYGSGSSQWNNNPGVKKKRSGAKFTRNSKTGEDMVSAWNVSREKGMVSILVFSTKFSDEATPSGGTKLCAKVTFRRTGETRLMSCIKSPKNNKYYISVLGWVINPLAPNGGYCGQSRYKR